MPDYTRGTVLGAATTLPATTATGMLLANNANTWIILSFMVISLISMIISLLMFYRFIRNY